MKFLVLHGSCLVLMAAASSAAADGAGTPSGREMQFPHALPGEPVVVEKVIANDGTIQLRSSSPAVRDWDDLEALRQRELEAVRQRYGNLHEQLWPAIDGRLAGKTEPGRRPVMVALNLPPIEHPNKYEVTTSALVIHSRALLAMRPAVGVKELLDRYGLVESGDGPKGDPLQFWAMVDDETLAAMAFDPDIAAIEPRRDRELTSYPYLSLTHSAYNPKPMPYGARGAGINVATFETGLHPDNVACMGLNPTRVDLHSTSLSRTEHSDLTFKALYNTAPAANHFHRNSLWFQTLASTTWIVDNSIRTASQSTIAFSNTPTETQERIMDDLSYRHPFTLFTNPTGNGGAQGTVPHWPHYNGVSVGNVRHTNESYFKIDGTTQTNNPAPRYGPAITGNQGDRELPTLVTPGLAPDPNNQPATDSCLPDFGFWGGTSMSAPITNGIAADVMSIDGRLLNSTERVKAVLVLTARNVEGAGWQRNVDERDGTGTISGGDAAWFAKNHTTVALNGEAQHGLAGGSLNNSNQGNILRFYIRTPYVKPIGRHLRVAVVWTSNPTLSVPVLNELSDLDLVVKRTSTGAVLGSSTSLDDNVEIVDLAADALNVNEQLTVEVHVVTGRVPANATAPFFYYAAGWTWPQDIFHAAPIHAGQALGVYTPTNNCADSAVVALLNGTAQQYCRERANNDLGAYSVSAPVPGAHSWWNGSAWATSGNSRICYLTNLACKTYNNPHYENPVPPNQYQIGVSTPGGPCTTSTTLGNSATKFCQERGFDYFLYYVPAGPASGVHTWWNGSVWATSGNANVCYMTDLGCWNY